MPGMGNLSPNVGLYGHEAAGPEACDSYIHNVIVAITLANIETIAGVVKKLENK